MNTPISDLDKCPNRVQLESFPPGSDIDGCSVPSAMQALFPAGLFITSPDQPSTNPLAIQFYVACAIHDIRYQTCTRDNRRATYDQELHNNLQGECNVISPGQMYRINAPDLQANLPYRDIPLVDVCNTSVSRVDQGIAAGSWFFYEQRQKQVCGCCRGTP